MQRKGKYPAPPGYPPNILGLEFAGEVEAVGDKVRTWEPGDRVFGITAGGAQAVFVVVAESNLAAIPERLHWTEAAAMPEVFITAHDALFTRGRLQIGERALIHADKGLRNLTLMVGKMANPFITSSMLWGPDINPEGLAEQWKHTFSFTLGGGGSSVAAEPATEDGKAVASVASSSEPRSKITVDIFANFGQSFTTSLIRKTRSDPIQPDCRTTIPIS